MSFQCRETRREASRLYSSGPACRPVQSFQISLNRYVPGKTIAEALLKAFFKHVPRLCQAIMHPCSLSASFDDSRRPHDSEMPGYFEIRLIKRLRKHADACLPLCGKQNRQPEPYRVGEGSEKIGFIAHVSCLRSLSAYLRRYADYTASPACVKPVCSFPCGEIEISARS